MKNKLSEIKLNLCEVYFSIIKKDLRLKSILMNYVN